MARVGRFRKGTSSAHEFAPGSDFNYDKKVWKVGQNRFRIIGDIVLKWVIWIDAVIEGQTRRLPIYMNGPDPEGPGYFDPETDKPTGEPRPHFLCKMVARMAASADPQIKQLAEGDSGMKPQPVFYANAIDLDKPERHKDSGKLVLLCNHEKGNTFSRSIAEGIEEQTVIYGGSEDTPADWETYNGNGLIFVVTKRVKGGNTSYDVSAMPADRPLTDEEKSWTPYDIEGEVANTTPVSKIKEWLGEGFLKEHGVTDEEMSAQEPWSPEKSKDGKTERAGVDGRSTTPATAPVATTTPPEPSEPSEPAEPSEPGEPSEPSEPGEPAEPADPSQEQVAGPDGDLLPPGVRFKVGSSGKPFFYHVTAPKKTAWSPEEVVPQ